MITSNQELDFSSNMSLDSIDLKVDQSLLDHNNESAEETDISSLDLCVEPDLDKSITKAVTIYVSSNIENDAFENAEAKTVDSEKDVLSKRAPTIPQLKIRTPLNCPLCMVPFTTKKRLDKHINNIHEGNQHFESVSKEFFELNPVESVPEDTNHKKPEAVFVPFDILDLRCSKKIESASLNFDTTMHLDESTGKTKGVIFVIKDLNTSSFIKC